MKIYMLTLTIAPSIKDRSIENFLSQRSITVVTQDEAAINDVLTKTCNIPTKRGEVFELVPNNSGHCFGFIDTKDIEGTCKGIKEVLDKIEKIAYRLESPKDIMNAAGIPDDTSQFNDLGELIMATFKGISNM